MGKKKKNRKKKNANEVEVMTEEEFFGFDFIAGFTPSGVPFGITLEEVEEIEKEMTELRMNEDLDLLF